MDWLHQFLGPEDGGATWWQLSLRAVVLFLVGIANLRIAGRRTCRSDSWPRWKAAVGSASCPESVASAASSPSPRRDHWGVHRSASRHPPVTRWRKLSFKTGWNRASSRHRSGVAQLSFLQRLRPYPPALLAPVATPARAEPRYRDDARQCRPLAKRRPRRPSVTPR